MPFLCINYCFFRHISEMSCSAYTELFLTMKMSKPKAYQTPCFACLINFYFKTEATVKKIILAGMPNCGKSSLFNLLTHSSVYVGNRAGVTVDCKGAPFTLPDGSRATLIDIPGITSLTPHTSDEEVAAEALFSSDADLIVNVIDVNDAENQLLLTMRLCELFSSRIPILICLNMCDVALKNGQSIVTGPLESFFGLPAVAVSASKGTGTDELKRQMALLCNSVPDKRNLSFPVSGTERKKLICGIVSQVLVGKRRIKNSVRRLDGILMNRRSGLPIFILTTALIMFVTFGAPGNLLSRFFSEFIITPAAGGLSHICGMLLTADAADFICGGVFNGIASVLMFLPRILLMFILLCALEDCGYMARAAELTDPWLRRMGLDGRACVSVMLGFGCCVPAIMSCRNMTDCRERTVCCSLLPLLSCSARVPVYSVISDYFFGNYGWIAAFSVHLLGTFMFFLISSAMKNLGSGGNSPHYTAALPPLRAPSPKHILRSAKNEALHFLRRAGTVILAVSCIIFLLSRYDFSFHASKADESMLSMIGGIAAKIFSPLGFDNWQAGAALICGIGAKEAVLSVLCSLCPSADTGIPNLAAIFTPCSALSFTVFMSMYLPCIATFITSCGEIGFFKTLRGAAISFCTAYLCASVVYAVSSAVT